jgi:dihydrofolate reductase
MGIVTTQHSSSIDGFIADRHGRSGPLHDWLRAGGEQSQMNPNFAMHPVNARFFDEGVGRCGAVIAGRRTYDVSNGWGGAGPMGPRPLFVVTGRAPDEVPLASPPYTFVTDGVASAVAAAKKAAGDQDVVLMGASMVQQCLRAGLLDELIISIVPVLLGSGVRLLDDGDLGGIALEVVSVIDAPGVTHLTYRVRR